MPDVTRYIQRISYLLRQGEPANQVAILLPTDDAWASFTPAHVTVTGAMQRLITPALMSAILSAGYNADFIDADAINSVGLGTHQILVIPPTDRIAVDTLKKILAWTENGGKVIAVGKLPTLTAEGKPLKNAGGDTSAIPLVPDEANLAQALRDDATPDLQILPTPTPKPAELVSRVVETTPDLALLAPGDKEFILQNGSPDDATKLFSAIKGKSDTIPALVIESSPQVLKVAVSDEAIQNRVADFTFMMAPLDPGAMHVWTPTAIGQMVWLTGTYTSYTVSPFMITMSDGAVVLSKQTPIHQAHAKMPGRENYIGFIRRKLPNADIYFVVNTSNAPITTTATFATSYKTGEAWDFDTAVSTPASPASQTLRLAPYGSRIFVFSAGTAASSPPPQTSASIFRPDKQSAKQIADLSSDWQVTFTATKETETEPTLTDWTTNPATLYYSGEAVYARDFALAAQTVPVYLEIPGGKSLPGAPNSPPEHGPQPGVLGPNGLPDPRITRPGPGMHAYFDPPIHEAAIVFINGQHAGSLWHPPYRLDISKLLKPGQNHIEIHVYNTALNAWSALPPHDYKPLIEKYGDRFQMQDLDKVQPIPSGILGPIHLVTEAAQQ